jgi:hypothetical protein
MPTAPVNTTKPSAPLLEPDVKTNHTKAVTPVSVTAAPRFYSLSSEINVGRAVNESSAPTYEAIAAVNLLEPKAPSHEGEPNLMDLASRNAANSRHESKPTKMTTAISVTKNMRASLFSHKEKREDSDQQDFALDKGAINKILSDIFSKLESVRDMGLLNPEDDFTATYLINFINEVQSLPCRNYRERIQEISTKITSLTSSYASLSNLNEQRDYLNAQIEQVAEQRITLNM